MAKLTWSAEELAAELGVLAWLVRRHLARIPHLRIGQRVVFPKFAVARWLEEEPLTFLHAEAAARADGRRAPIHGVTSTGAVSDERSPGHR